MVFIFKSPAYEIFKSDKMIVYTTVLTKPDCLKRFCWIQIPCQTVVYYKFYNFADVDNFKEIGP